MQWKGENIFISQPKNAKEILKEFMLTNCKTSTTPLKIGWVYLHKVSKKGYATLYNAMVGSIAYLIYDKPYITLSFQLWLS